MVHAWHTAQLTRMEKVPELDTLLMRGATKPVESPTVNKHRVMITGLSEHLGIPLRPRVRSKRTHG